VINTVSASFVANCKSFEIFMVNIWECIDKITEMVVEATPHMRADLEMWRLRMRKAITDLFELPTGDPLASKFNFPIYTDPAATVHHPQPYGMTDPEHLQFGIQITGTLANG